MQKNNYDWQYNLTAKIVAAKRFLYYNKIHRSTYDK